MAPMTRPLVALDVQVPQRSYPFIEAAGVELFEAGAREPDEQWFGMALRLGARAVVSPDHDLRRLCAQHRIPWIRLPGEHPGNWIRQTDFIVTNLIRLKIVERGPGSRAIDAARREWARLHPSQRARSA
jgi:hypothetical protein